MTNESTMAIEQDLMNKAEESLELFVQLLKTELYEDFEINCATNKVTDKQKALLPLYAQLISAHHVSQSSRILFDEVAPAIERMAARR
jgi:hypothetical protein